MYFLPCLQGGNRTSQGRVDFHPKIPMLSYPCRLPQLHNHDGLKSVSITNKYHDRRQQLRWFAYVCIRKGFQGVKIRLYAHKPRTCDTGICNCSRYLATVRRATEKPFWERIFTSC